MNVWGHHCTVEEMDDGSLSCEECGAVYEPEEGP